MSANKETIKALRETLRLSPDNIPLRKHLADLLLKEGEFENAEKEYRQVLSLSPDDAQVKLGLAETFYQLKKNSAALVILEELMEDIEPPARVFLLSARLFLRTGETDQAVKAYRQVIQRDPSLSDGELERQLKIDKMDILGDDRLRVPVEDIPLSSNTTIEKPKLSFEDVGGMEQLKEEIRMKIIHPLNHPEIYKAYGKPIGGGILMYGPPGCGKTYLAKATAGEVNACFLAIGIHDVLNMYLGQSEHNLHELFELARSNTPCVLFFDEVDALGASRSDMRRSAGKQLINQFLLELDGVNSSNEGVLILAATNAPWHLDSAFRRPGRFDRILFVPPPDLEARAAILQIMLKDKPVEKIDYGRIAKKTDGFSGADLKAVVDVAIENKLQEAIKKGVPTPLTAKNVLSATKNLRSSTKEWFATARNYALYSNQSGIYDDILAYLNL